MLEINANAQFAGRHKLRASGDSSLTVDGPKGFELVVAVVGGSPVTYSRNGGLGATGLLGKGSQITVHDRVVLQTTGPTSIIDVFKPEVA